MPRIAGIAREDAPEQVRQVLDYARAGFLELTGRENDAAMEPMQMYAHHPDLLVAYAGFEAASAELSTLPRRLQALAELKAATLTSCEFCIDLGSQISRRWGLSDDELLALPAYQESPLFDAIDRLVLDYAVAMSRTPVEVTDEMVEALKAHLSEAQIIEPTHDVALENMRGRFNMSLGIGSAGFSDGMVCAIPERVAAG